MNKKKFDAFIKRLDAVDDEIEACKEDQKAIYGEMKDAGYTVKLVKKARADKKALEKLNVDDLDILETYRHALGLTPLERAIEDAKEAEGEGGDKGSKTGSAKSDGNVTPLH